MELDPSRTLLRLLSNVSGRATASGAPVPDAARAAVSTAETASLGLRTGELVTVRVLAEATAPMMQVARANERGPTQAATPQSPKGEGRGEGAARGTNAVPMQVTIKGRNLLAEVPVGTRPGDQFHARVVRADGQPQLEVLDRDALNRQASIVGHYRQLIPQARPHPDSLRALQRLVDSTSQQRVAGASGGINARPPTASQVSEIAGQLLGRVPNPTDLLKPEGLRRAVMGNGMQFENRLSTAFEVVSAAQTPDDEISGEGALQTVFRQLAGRDLKGALLLARAQLSDLSGQLSEPLQDHTRTDTGSSSKPGTTPQTGLPDPAARHPASAGVPVTRSGPPTPDSRIQGSPAAVPALTPTSDIARTPNMTGVVPPTDPFVTEAARVVDGMLAEIEAQQLGQQIARDEGLPRLVELPLLPDPLLKRVEIAMDDAPPKSREASLGDEEFSLTLRVDLGIAGPLLVRLRYAPLASSATGVMGRIAVTLTARRASLADALTAELPALRRALGDAGLEVRALESRLGTVPDRLRRVSADRNIISVRT